MRKTQLSFWSLEGGELGLGNASLLDQPLTAFFSSRQCPGSAIRAAMNWAVEQARGQHPVVIGMAPTTQRLTAALAARRNDWVAQRAARIVIAHAAAGGGLVQQANTWQQAGRPIEYLSCTTQDY